MKELTINGKLVKTNDDGLISLTDLFNIACKEGQADNKLDPRGWVQKPRGKKSGSTGKVSVSGGPGYEFIVFVAKSLNVDASHIQKGIKGKGGGTYAHWQIALAYAKYLSEELHMQVNEVYARYITGDITLAAEISDKATEADNLWLAKRIDGKVARVKFTDTLQDHGVTGFGFATCTDAINKHVVGGSAVAIRKERGIGKKESLRDVMSIEELVATSMSELVSIKRITMDAVFGNSRCTSVCDKSAASVMSLLQGATA